MDVVASDFGHVQSYLSGKLPFVVRLPKIESPEPRSLGARVIQLDNRDTAYVRYDTPAGRVSVFVYEDVDRRTTWRELGLGAAGEDDGPVTVQRVHHLRRRASIKHCMMR